MMEDETDIVKEVLSFIDIGDKEQEWMNDCFDSVQQFQNDLAKQQHNVKADIDGKLIKKLEISKNILLMFTLV